MQRESMGIESLQVTDSYKITSKEIKILQKIVDENREKLL